ncbi:MAG TPA: nucleoside 2-deoxyribosyltransferase [Candidatus Sulfotelmatobacter sp.]|nr:nucleoside 2-deoxyribosyltransferase [Candidatus Sulfotelmatobacter sp.]
MRIYCAGPLYNRAEREEMAEIAQTLEAAGFHTFLPHRDGFLASDVHRELLRGGYDPREAAHIVGRAVFWLDTFEVVTRCQGLVMNMNGRVPDEGAAAEAAMAWTTGKSIVLYKSDSRNSIHGSDNEMLLGLGGFVKVTTIPEIACAFAQFSRVRRRATGTPVFPASVRPILEQGRRLSGALTECDSLADIAAAIARVARQAEGRG